MQGLEGVKVLELGTMVAAAYATKLMADLGADVIKVEEPQGAPARQRGPFPGGVVDPEKSGLFLYLNGVRIPASLLGQHTEEVLRDVLGYTDEDIAQFRAQQVLY
jgi:crotonobetainyl-CoA:carnitine CoA-transferase CaiB-like acyl-CoA transferase